MYLISQQCRSSYPFDPILSACKFGLTVISNLSHEQYQKFPSLICCQIVKIGMCWTGTGTVTSSSWSLWSCKWCFKIQVESIVQNWQWPKVSDFVTSFCMLLESKNLLPCENDSRVILAWQYMQKVWHKSYTSGHCQVQNGWRLVLLHSWSLKPVFRPLCCPSFVWTL